MTIEEFDTTGFGNGDLGIYKNKEYAIASVDFEERLVGLLMNISGGEPDDISWVRCENIEYIQKPY
jgi:hypothetical protein